MRLHWLISLICLLLPGVAASAQLENVRIWAAPDSTRVVFDVSGPVVHKLEMLTDPYRAVIDIQDTQLIKTMTQPGSTDKFLHRVRSAPRSQNDLRVVLDLKKHVDTQVFLLPPNERYGHRLVIDLYDKDKKKHVQKVAIDRFPNRPRAVVIAIDAGHGGEDPGARGLLGNLSRKGSSSEAARWLAEKENASDLIGGVSLDDKDL